MFFNGVFLELARCLASLTLATGSAVTSRMPVPMIEADAPVTIAIAEPADRRIDLPVPALRLLHPSEMMSGGWRSKLPDDGPDRVFAHRP